MTDKKESKTNQNVMKTINKIIDTFKKSPPRVLKTTTCFFVEKPVFIISTTMNILLISQKSSQRTQQTNSAKNSARIRK